MSSLIAGTNLIAIGDCSWQPSALPLSRDVAFEVPTLTEPWMGRKDQAAAFKAAYDIGLSYLGGYITDRNFKDNSPFPGMSECDLIIALQPNVLLYLADPNTAIKTVQKSATVNGRLDDNGQYQTSSSEQVQVVYSASYYAPETHYTYFASARPNGPRFSAVLSTWTPRIITASIKVSGQGHEATYGYVAPAPIASAVTLGTQDRLTSFEATQIKGTPWYQCRDVISREFLGDT